MSPTFSSGPAPSPTHRNGSSGSSRTLGAPQRNGQTDANSNGHASGGSSPGGDNGGENGGSSGKGGNGGGKGRGGLVISAQPPTFDRPVIFRQPSLWAKIIIGTIIGVTTFSVGWACWAKVDEAIPAQGKLEPRGSVKEIQAPLGGVVSSIEVKEGDRVAKGQVLVRFDQTAAQAQLASLKEVRNSLLAESLYYQAQLTGQAADLPEGYSVPPAIAALTRNRASLVAENDLFRAQYNGSSTAVLDANQQARLQTNNAERNSRERAAQLAKSQQQQQLNQVQIRIANAELRIRNAETQLANASQQLTSTVNALAIDQRILKDITELAEEGGIANIQFLRQKQEVGNGEARVTQRQAEVSDSAAELDNQKAELRQLRQEEQRLQLAVAQADEELLNTTARSLQDPLSRLADNDKRIAEIDSQLNKIIVENAKRINEIDGQIQQTQVTLGYQELTAPVSGVVFDLQPTSKGFVSNSSEPILKIVPDEGLVARVFITNSNIGFIQECTDRADPSTCMDVDVRIDSFPFSEYGDIDGKLVEIGSDVLPPDQIFPFYRFPAKVTLAEQFINVDGRPIALQSGMSISVNIKTRPRRVITYFTDLFAKKKDSFTSRQ